MIGFRDLTLGRGLPVRFRLMLLAGYRAFSPSQAIQTADGGDGIPVEVPGLTPSKLALLLQRIAVYELGLCLYLNRGCRVQLLRNLLTAVSRLGDGIFWYMLILFLPLALGVAGLMASMHMLAVGTAGLIVYRRMKRRTGRIRPFHTNQEIMLGARPLDFYSFPSGHTLHAVGFSLVAVQYLPLLFWPLLPFVVLVAVSRIVLGLHYPTDVLGGALIGLAIAFGSFVALPWFLNLFPNRWLHADLDAF